MTKLKMMVAAVVLVAVGVLPVVAQPMRPTDRKALRDAKAGVVPALSIGTDELAADAVTGDKLADDSVGTNNIANTTLKKVALAKGVVSLTGSHLQLEYGATTNGGTVTWSQVFAGTPAIVAGYAGQAATTNSVGGYASAHVSAANSTNCVVAGDAVDATAWIDVIAVGVTQ